MSAGNWDWRNWTAVHPVKSVFVASAGAVLNLKKHSVGALPKQFRQPDFDFLSESQSRLAAAMSQGGMERRLSELLQAEGPGLTATFAAQCAEVMETLLPGQAAFPADRVYLIGQFLAMTAGLWDDPAQAMLYAASQSASHTVVRRSLGETEPQITTMLCEELRSALGRDFVGSLRAARVGLPVGSHLEFGTASMQGRSDRLGADLAVAIGTIVEGVPMYRVALLQAKRETVRGFGNVSEGQGQQLKKILNTGMGYYLFFPGRFQDRTFLPTVRSAQDINKEVYIVGEQPRYRVDVCGGTDGAEPAWDFAAFLAIAMTSPALDGVGRLFPDVSAVCKALSEERTKPLGSEMLYADLTGALKVHQFIEELPALGYGDPDLISSAPAGFDDPDIDGMSEEGARGGFAF